MNQNYKMILESGHTLKFYYGDWSDLEIRVCEIATGEVSCFHNSYIEPEYTKTFKDMFISAESNSEIDNFMDHIINCMPSIRAGWAIYEGELIAAELECSPVKKSRSL